MRLQVDRLTEKAEDGAAAATHGTIGGTQLIEARLYLAYLGMDGEDTLLEIVGKLFAPGVDGLQYDVATVSLRMTGRDEREGLLGRNGYCRTDDGDIPALQVEGDGGENLADPLGIGWQTLDEDE